MNEQTQHALLFPFLALCSDSNYSKITYCEDYTNPKICRHICSFSRDLDFIKKGLDNLCVEAYIEGISNTGVMTA